MFHTSQRISKEPQNDVHFLIAAWNFGLQEITCEKAFNLSCRLVEFFEEDNGIALWIEDGTRCSLFTCSDQTLQPYDSQVTQDVCNNCLRICVRCSKALVRNLAPLERNMLLYLRHVETSVQFSSLLVGNVAQFEVKGGVELLPINTRYSLIQKNLECITIIKSIS